MQETILITGAMGFIGKNIVESFKDKYTLLAPSHNELDLLNQKDVHDYFRNHHIDTVIHCANVGGTRKTSVASGQTLETNLRMFFNLTENKKYYTRLFNLGSGAEYNKNRPLQNVSESAFGKEIPQDEYGFSKFIISHYIEKALDMYCLRPFGLFGKYEDYEFKFISNAIVKNLLHMPIRIRQNVVFSWMYINDFMKVLDFFINNYPTNSDYNITPSLSTDLITLAQTINSLSDYQSEIIVETPGYNNEYTGDNRRLTAFMGIVPFTPMNEAIKELIDYYKHILPTINTDTIRNDVYAKKCVIR